MTIKSKVIKFTTAASFAVAGITTLSAAKLNTLSFNHTAQAATVQTPAKEIGVVKVNYKPGQSVTVWNSYKNDKHATGRYLQHESQWKVYQKVKDANSNVWYDLGEDQWVSADFVEEVSTIATTLDLAGQPVSQVPAAPVATTTAAQTTTTASTNASAVATTPVQTNTAVATSAQAPVQTKQVATQAAPAVNTVSTQTVAPAKTQQAYTASTQQTVSRPATYSAPVQRASVQTAAPKHQTTQQSTQSKPAATQSARPQQQTAAQSNSSVAQTVVSAAQSQIGKPYAWGATGPNSFDCSGLVQYAYSQAGKNVGRTTYQQAGAGQHVSVSQAQAGDILMWGNYHDAIYVGNNQYVHAPQPGQNVTQASISSYFMPDYAIRVR